MTIDYRDIDPYVEDGSNTTAANSFLSLMSMSRTNGLLPAWYSPTRDARLRQLWKESGHLASAVNTLVTKITSVPFTIQARNRNNRASVQRAEEATRNLQTYSQQMQGLKAAFTLFLQDYFTQDNGAFMVLLAPPNKDTGDFFGPVNDGDLVYGVKHLDSACCTRTGDFEFPVVYRPLVGKLKGKAIKLHMSRVITAASMPSADETRNGVGFCALSRAFDAAQAIMDIVQYNREKMGSMPMRQLLIFSGMTPKDVEVQSAEARKKLASSGNSLFAKTVEYVFPDPHAKAELINLVSAPDNFDEKVSITLAMYAMALAFDVDARTFWSATETGATKGDANIQHLKAYGQGIALALRLLEELMDKYVLPADVQMLYDYIDDEQDRLQAEVRKTRATQRSQDVATGVYDVRTARLRALDNDDLTQAEFDALELKDGRLPEGLPALSLFQSNDEAIQLLLDVGVTDPLDVNANNAAEMLEAIRLRLIACSAQAINSTRDKDRQRALLCMAALTELQKLYSTPTDEDSDPLPEDDPDGLIVKSLEDYRRSLRALARGYYNGDYDRFTFVDDMVSAIGRNFTQAWNRGISSCGITPAEMTEDEQKALESRINSELVYVLGFADAVDAAREKEEAITTLFSRLELWVSRYNEVQDYAKITVCKDKKFRWVYDPIKEHCDDCSKLNGRVYRGSIWAKYGIYPKSRSLGCGGWQCGCRFEETTDPVTKGRPPRLSKEFTEGVIEHGSSTECGCGHSH